MIYQEHHGDTGSGGTSRGAIEEIEGIKLAF
jgi:hypothetical protein